MSFTTMYLISTLSYSFYLFETRFTLQPRSAWSSLYKILASQSWQLLCLSLPGGTGHHIWLSHSYFKRTYFFYDLMYSMLGTAKNYPEDRFYQMSKRAQAYKRWQSPALGSQMLRSLSYSSQTSYTSRVGRASGWLVDRMKHLKASK